MISASYRAELPEIAELVKGYWEEIGIETTIKPLANAIFNANRQEYNYEVAMALTNMGFAEYSPAAYTPNPAVSGAWAGKWNQWFATGGADGEEPPAEVKRIVEIAEQIKRETSEERKRIVSVIDQVTNENFPSLLESIKRIIGGASIPEVRLDQDEMAFFMELCEEK